MMIDFIQYYVCGFVLNLVFDNVLYFGTSRFIRVFARPQPTERSDLKVIIWHSTLNNTILILICVVSIMCAELFFIFLTNNAKSFINMNDLLTNTFIKRVLHRKFDLKIVYYLFTLLKLVCQCSRPIIWIVASMILQWHFLFL